MTGERPTQKLYLFIFPSEIIYGGHRYTHVLTCSNMHKRFQIFTYNFYDITTMRNVEFEIY